MVGSASAGMSQEADTPIASLAEEVRVSEVHELVLLAIFCRLPPRAVERNLP